ncbi:endonuclease/exonuclease/phosphatase family protein [Mesorhizobium sp. WSM2239]|uniref:Endonuclease/exonuclease/phosphatase family protein n=2 Tax=unclassified Mesorhizobium TaxID=325217 RepID=A0AAU8DDX7_9HYPH
MKCVSYNIQYGIGLDDRYDIARIADAVRGADVIALQEVSRNNPKNQGHDMVLEIRAALPGYFSVYGPNFEADIGSHVKDGQAVNVMFQFGNMVLSKSPIRLSRNLLLPRTRSYGYTNFQRGALEALIDTPLGPVRFYSTHLDHRSPEERLAQTRFLRERLLSYPLEGGALSGLSEMGFPEPPHAEAFVVMGDFNMLAGSSEYLEMTGRADHEFGMPLIATRPADAAARVSAGEPATTWVDPKCPEDKSRWKRIDYAFVSAGLVGGMRRSWVDHTATGSDHQPLWIELE